VDIGLNDALDLGWKTLSECFRPDEVGIKQEFIDSYWPAASRVESCVVNG
jgi:V/A-type H+-transporting ATPase subunit B